MKLRELYNAILVASGAIVTDDDLISITRPDDDPVFCMVSEKRLAMPSEKLLNKGAFNPDGSLIAFHPMSENVVLGTSPVLTQLEKMMTFRLTWIIRELVMQLVTVAANPKQHKKMKTSAHGLLSAMPEADDRTRKDFIKIMENSSAMGQRKLISLYVRPGGVYGGDKVSRLARFFPAIVDALDQEKRSLFGVNLRIADVPAFLALFEYILPDYRDPDRYASPSNSLIAPTFHALVRTYAKVANQLNKIIDMHAAQLNDPDALRINTDWLDSVHDLSPYREIIPVLPGNDGAEGTKVVKMPVQKAQVTQPGIAATPVVPNRNGGKGISVDDAIRAMTPPRQTFQTFQQPTGSFVNRGFRQQQDEGLPSWAKPAQTTWGTQAGGNMGGRFQRGGGYGGGGGRL